MSTLAMQDTLLVFDQTGSWSTGSQYPSTAPANPFIVDKGWSRYGAYIYWTKGTETGVYIWFESKRPGAAGFSGIQAVTPEAPTLNLDVPNRITLTTTASGSCYIPLCFGFWSGFPLYNECRVGVNITGAPNGTTRVAVYLVPGRGH